MPKYNFVTFSLKKIHKKNLARKASFTRIFNITVCVSGTFDLFNVMCKQYHWTALNAF